MTNRTWWIERRVPRVDEHRALFDSVGWGGRIPEASLTMSLRRSVVGVVAMDRTGPIGMARVVGDGAHYLYIQDVVVDPRMQDEAVGSALLDRLLSELAAIAGPEAFVGLFASDEAVGLYRSRGFDTDEMLGMHRVLGVSGRPTARPAHEAARRAAPERDTRSGRRSW